MLEISELKNSSCAGLLSLPSSKALIAINIIGIFFPVLSAHIWWYAKRRYKLVKLRYGREIVIRGNAHAVVHLRTINQFLKRVYLLRKIRQYTNKKLPTN